MKIAPKLSWQERVRQVNELHVTMLRGNERHTIRDTAKILNRSYGSVNEDITLASWMKSHPRIEKFRTIQEALEFVRAKKKEMRLDL